MGRQMHVWTVLGLCLASVMAIPFKRAPMYGCKSGHCSMLVSVLRDPRMVPNWNTDAWNKAITQLHAYQQLFSNEDDIEDPEESSRRRRRSLPELELPPRFIPIIKNF
ncbi:unnamed protein product [Bursaphelenchus xylophilus]|uniref:(pine wood nematode) hypothetical protein n=1 Tax=Bursaphelenchus xylophilus TaxID=6326 RepID=A0A1I7SQY3_BURXY|nr:unnamed protein product [Bursaphelenchus xylophilus]CAG9110559.1 unnamed protein product [Bursaphelenchus xylophilus]